ncbi:DNA primase [Mariniflexile litorale]|uniref:DNA primase n=1 Tax=Mariniflexile litorale TaxID=3045158 RepID=A0AAU7EBY5_9FLAO|nr:DNA primase [Mariniflexile sp. KMM 9835]MDQ8210506.1 DNA primase [Mariniflexile sp. KMM 9835]
MIRKIVDYKKLNEDILNLLVEKFPDGYDEADIISFRNAQNEIIEAVEVRTDDTIYLVKVGKRLVQAMEDFGDDDADVAEDDFEEVKVDDPDADLEDDDDDIVIKKDSSEDDDDNDMDDNADSDYDEDDEDDEDDDID